MPVNIDKPQNWKSDITKSVDMYNQWFMNFAPKAFRDTRIEATKDVEETLKATALLHGSDNSRKPPLPVIQAMRFV